MANEQVSELTILNGALLMLGDDPIVSLDENTKRRKVATGLFATSRDTVLRMHPWNSAVKRALLSPLADAPVSTYAYLYVLPSDLLRLLDVSTDDYKVEARHIACNISSLACRYIYRNVNYETWDALLVQTMQAYMAMVLAYPITKSLSTRDAMKSLLADILKIAKAVDAQEEPGGTFGSNFPLLAARGRIA